MLVFNTLKDKYKEIIEYQINLDHNTTMYLEHDITKRIGIIIQNS